MADKAISELVAASQVTPTDLFVLEQNQTAKKLTGQTLENWLLEMAEGHGGIQSIEKTGTSGLVDTYTVTLSDLTKYSFTVTNGRSITGIQKTGTVGLVDTYTMSFNDGNTFAFTVTNGEKGDKGDNAYVHIKWASQEPTESSHSFGDIPDDWMGVYSGNAPEAPTDWQEYSWFEVKGDKGDTGDAAQLLTQTVSYQVSDSGTIYPSGEWLSTIPPVPQGKYLWTRTTLTFNSGTPIVSYSVSRFGIDGSGAVSTVNQVSPDSNGNVSLSASDVGALPTSGGTMAGQLDMNGQVLTGLNDPVSGTDAARKGYVDNKIGEIPEGQSVKDYVDGQTIETDPTLSIEGAAADAKAVGDALVHPNLLDNWYFKNPVNQRGVSGTLQMTDNGLINTSDTETIINTTGYFIDRWKLVSGTVEITDNGLILNGTIEQILEFAVGQTTKASVLTSTGVVDGVYDDSANTFTITAAGLTIIAAKLELGDIQTLAHEENGTWVLNEIPDYGEQLETCQRCSVKLVLERARTATVNHSYFNFLIPVPVTLRAKPVIEKYKTLSVRTMENSPIDGFTYSIASYSAANIIINATKASHGQSDACLVIQNLLISADL